MNHSIYSADRATHLKIVVIALVAGVALSGFTLAGHTTFDDARIQTVHVTAANKPAVVASSAQLAIR